MSLDLTAELRALGVALGVLDGDGDLRPDWFSDPLKHIRRILLDPDQRAALLDAIDGLLPEDPDGPDAQGETRHPLLDPDQAGAASSSRCGGRRPARRCSASPHRSAAATRSSGPT